MPRQDGEGKEFFALLAARVATGLDPIRCPSWQHGFEFARHDGCRYKAVSRDRDESPAATEVRACLRFCRPSALKGQHIRPCASGDQYSRKGELPHIATHRL